MNKLEIRTSVIVVEEINLLNRSQIQIEVYIYITEFYSVLV